MKLINIYMEKNNDENKDIKKYKTFNKLQDIQTLIKNESSRRKLCK